MAAIMGMILFLSSHYTLDGIKSKTVGDGQHGTGRWATRGEINKTFCQIPFEPALWRKGEKLPKKAQGLILGSPGKKNAVTAMVDTDDIHYVLPERAAREVAYADKNALLRSIHATYPRTYVSAKATRKAEGGGSMRQTDAQTMADEHPEALEEKAEYRYNLGDGGTAP